jgi:quercetin dioxygenase-like cupin family protein
MTSHTQAGTYFLGHGQDRFATPRGLGITRVNFKVASADTDGRVFVTEQTMLAKGGPPRHLHLDQEEWFYSLEGEFILEVGPDRFTLNPGDSAFAPRRIPHVWAYVGTGPGRLLIAFTPAGQMEAFFHAVAQTNAMPAQDPALWRAHGMEVVGPPLPVD